MDLYGQEFLEAIIPLLVVFYALTSAANLGAVVYCARRKQFVWMLVWLGVAAGFAAAAVGAWLGRPPAISEAAKHAIDGAMCPASVMIGFFVLLLVLYLGRAFFVRPAVVLPVEMYTPERKAQFLLENAVDQDDYERSAEEVRRMGLDPEAIPHQRP